MRTPFLLLEHPNCPRNAFRTDFVQLNMRPHSIVLAASLILAPILCASGQSTSVESPKFKPAELTSAVPITYPINSVAWGVVVLQAVVKESGDVGKITPIREITSLTAPAVATVARWHFQPATLGDKPVRSRVEIAVMFNQHLQVSTAKLPPISMNNDQDPRDSSLQPQPPDVLSASSAIEPIYTSGVLGQAVVLQLRIGGGGEIENIKAIKDVVPFTAAASDALKNWLFAAPRYNGKFISAPIFVAFAFQPPPATDGQ
jgi:Gram-negative bacterial TonB protein C-terminal